MIGHVVLRHVVTDDEDVVAVWHVSVDGTNTGAWIVPSAEAFTDPEAARRLVGLCADRLLVGWEPSFDLVRRLEAVAGSTPRRWVALSVPDAVAEIAEIRAACEKRVEERRADNAAIVSLEWRVDLPDALPGTEEEMHQYAHLAPPPFDPGAAAGLLLTCRLVRWTLRRWQETAVALERRAYLRDDVGEPDVLPPQWLRAMTEAMAGHPGLRWRREGHVA
ncbi:hypothetical protein SAMN05216553_106246 [Lentzea fradiae]|uniref:Uncharacterized protein n=1 Tax=Lentzea fradiae TaxID=200378 RepID=A0A1G7SGF3_9PSEU|nr:DUF6218 family protein [Lentzea fradiae]SDG22157.1 hypothetical protein SAMN05216553_106246 [Lentzea fradiae]